MVRMSCQYLSFIISFNFYFDFKWISVRTENRGVAYNPIKFFESQQGLVSFHNEIEATIFSSVISSRVPKKNELRGSYLKVQVLFGKTFVTQADAALLLLLIRIFHVLSPNHTHILSEKNL